MNKILLNAGKKSKKWSSYVKTFATRLYKENKDLVLVQEALGHSDLNTSRIYTHLIKRLKKTTNIMEKL